MDAVGTAGRTSYHLRMSEAWGPAHPDGTSKHLVQHGSTTIRRVEVDEGLKEFGVWLDGLGDWREQMQKIRDGLSETPLQELGRKRIPLELAFYLWKAVITPKALYPLAVASPPDDEIVELVKWALGTFRRQFGVHPSFPYLRASRRKRGRGVGDGVVAVSGGEGTWLTCSRPDQPHRAGVATVGVWVLDKPHAPTSWGGVPNRDWG
jgi:hypothetical protein